MSNTQTLTKDFVKSTCFDSNSTRIKKLPKLDFPSDRIKRPESENVIHYNGNNVVESA